MLHTVASDLLITRLQDIVRALSQRIYTVETRESIPVTIVIADATGSLALTAANQDVPGATLSLTPGVYQITGIFDFQTGNDDNDNGQTAHGVLDIGGAAEATEAILLLVRIVSAHRMRATISYTWEAAFAAQTTVKLRARKSAGTGASQCLQTNTRLVATRLALKGV